MYLPAYSPDFNPIEEGFSAMKAYIRRHWKRYCDVLIEKDEGDSHDILTEAVFESMQPEKIHGWFTHSGYIPQDE